MRRGLTILRWAAFAAVLLVFARALAAVDLARAAGLLHAAGPSLLLALVPYGVAIALDSAAFTALLGAVARPVVFGRILRVRLAAEALAGSVPAGALVAESLVPSLLARGAGLRVPESLAGMGARKWLQTRGHAAYLATAALVGWGALEAASRGLVGSRGLPFVVLASALVPLALSTAAAMAMRHGSLAARAHATLARVPIAPLRRWLEARGGGFRAADAELAAAGARARRVELRATLLYLGAWLMESCETWLLLHLLGARLGFAEVLAFEAALSLVRCLAFFAPSGIGVQDLGYLACLQALGVADAAPLGAAFVVLKRAKEVAWIALGYALLFAQTRPVTARVSLEELGDRGARAV